MQTMVVFVYTFLPFDRFYHRFCFQNLKIDIHVENRLTFHGIETTEKVSHLKMIVFRVPLYLAHTTVIERLSIDVSANS